MAVESTRARPVNWRRPAWLDAVGEWFRDRTKLLDSPLATHHVLLGATSVLVVIGLVMVLSSSSVEALTEYGSPYAIFKKQALFAVFGALVLAVASRVPARTWQRLAVPALFASAAFQLLVFVPHVGKVVNGNRNWIVVGPLSAQPSEAAKITLVLALALALTRRREVLHEPAKLLGALLAPVGLTIGVVLLTKDLGTALIMMAVVVVMLWVAGIPGRWFLLAGGGAAFVAFLAVVTSDNRMGRVEDWLSGTSDSATAIQGLQWQPVQGKYALASGGWWGLGLGASREKWSWLPEAHNDFIFAIIGEELGLPGTLTILVLFAVVALMVMRLVKRSEDLYTKLAVSGIGAWILVQAVVNVGVVLSLFPVIGVPLPLISAGGSALVLTLLGIGILLSFARAEPGAPEAIRARESVVARSLAVLPQRRTAQGSARGAARTRTTKGHR
ncbi:putative lipid II flippase FtsW [Kineococcus rhizosphaerae]|uniref:Probable peptidoglycan glycosyltransferase FtsW n=1 Tax=Kineococcus rhizosphaerae TaxID=559628 RepID=A0A2T0R8N7_9ACTN|nr:putative lipid II flippase FtsW [Kineococcus rhizosphaerae]PRY17536.1 cell division-specific peptidoglycan biosynthesis regulator FtsW [Kineococcus rhizosphaerae]